jgi:hypothetical protein
LNYRLPYIFVVFVVVLHISVPLGFAREIKEVPAEIYAVLDDVLSLAESQDSVDPAKFNELVDFVRATPVGSQAELEPRDGAAGALFVFDIEGGLADVLEYGYSPDVPAYMTMPSSLQNHQWITPEVHDELRRLLRDHLDNRNNNPVDRVRLLRGKEHEIITPDLNTGGYYAYTQDRLVALMPGSAGPVLISTTIQSEPSMVGKKGCVVGDDKDWNYLYSDEKGINKTGLGWVESYMYRAYSVMVYATDLSAGTVRAASFKWLNAGWAKINMVKSHHILNGIKRFASDFKTILESPHLPAASTLADKYQELVQMSEQELRRRVAPYLEKFRNSGNLETCSELFTSLVSSGDYLKQMSVQEMIRILMLDYLRTFVAESPQGNTETLSLKNQTLESRS